VPFEPPFPTAPFRLVKASEFQDVFLLASPEEELPQGSQSSELCHAPHDPDVLPSVPRLLVGVGTRHDPANRSRHVAEPG